MRKKLSVFSLTLITVCSVDSIRNLPVAAMAGGQLFLYFSLALIFFLLPCTIIACWFSPQSNQGIYGWIKKGLGRRFAFMAIWFQCVQNVLIYPTFLSFIAGTFLYSFAPELSENKPFLFLMVCLLIWGLTWVNLKGIQTSSRFNSLCSITGILIPFGLILVMGMYWWLTQIPSGQTVLPPAQPYSWTSLTVIILAFCGIELAGVHVNESKPGAFPKAVVISIIIIFLSTLFGSVTLAMIIPLDQLNFINNIPQLIQLFFSKMHCEPLAAGINVLIAIGCMGGANNWLIVPVKGLSFATEDGFIEEKFTRLNENQVPARLLIIQASAVTLISSLFLVIPAVNASYWLLLNSATQILLLMYLLLFLAAIKVVLAEKPRLAKVLLGSSFLGILGVIVSLIVSLNPPPALQFHPATYALLGIAFLTLFIASPLILFKRQNPSYTLFSNRV